MIDNFPICPKCGRDRLTRSEMVPGDPIDICTPKCGYVRFWKSLDDLKMEVEEDLEPLAFNSVPNPRASYQIADDLEWIGDF
jgi:hypothetical protein